MVWRTIEDKLENIKKVGFLFSITENKAELIFRIVSKTLFQYLKKNVNFFFKKFKHPQKIRSPPTIVSKPNHIFKLLFVFAAFFTATANRHTQTAV